MLTLKFVDDNSHSARTVSVPEYTAQGDGHNGIIVSFDDEEVVISNRDNAEDYAACYVMNQSGKTIDTIRVGRKR